MDRFNSMFVTEKDERNPIWFYNLINDSLKIDIHVQLTKFELGEHTFIMNAVGSSGTSLLSSDPMSVITNDEAPVFNDEHGNPYGAGEFIFFIEMDKNDVSKIGSHLTITVKMDNKIEGTFVLLMRSNANG